MIHVGAMLFPLTSNVIRCCLVGPFFFTGLMAILCLAAAWERR